MTGAPAAGRAIGLRLFDRLLGRRRNYLIDPAYQIRTAVVAVVGMTFVVGVAAGLLHLLRSSGAGSALHEGSRGEAPGAGWPVFLVVAGVVLVGAVFVVEILETHRTAGVALRLSRALRALRDGCYGTRLTLRRQDNFRELEEAFNETARSLGSWTEEEAAGLARLTDLLDGVKQAMETGDRAGGEALLRQLRGGLEMMRERHQDRLRPAPEEQIYARI
jgi:hypothetical protein